MKNLIILCVLFPFYSVFAQHSTYGKKNINADWEFVRIDLSVNDDKTSEQGVQNGSDWHSQFNIEKGDGQNVQGTALTDSLIATEFRWLEQQTWKMVNLPHTAKVEPYAVVTPWEGIAFYKKTISLNEHSNSFIKFEGAMQLTDVWVNGIHQLQHIGGYTSFSVDLSEFKGKKEVDVLVRVDNRDHPFIPPGKPIENLDFCYYSGIYRNVYLIEKNDLFITDAVHANKVAGGGVFVTYPEVSQEKAEIAIKVDIKNVDDVEKQFSIQAIITERASKKVMANYVTEERIQPLVSEDYNLSLLLKNPLLWDVDEPNLYDLQIYLKNGRGVLDSVITTIGVRKIEITREKGTLLNGKAIRLVGTNRHMDYPYVGNALPENATYRDLYNIKEAGFNTVRLGHYPQDPAVYEACNELGLLVINPMPGWQYFNKNQAFIDATYQDIRDMVRRDRNHPSIIMWETILNEAWPPSDWKDGAHQVAHEEFPYEGCFTSGDMYGYSGWDIMYNDWKEDITRPSHPTKPGFIREYGDYEFGGHYSTTRKTRNDGQENLLHNAWNFMWSHNRYRKQYPATIGDANWSMYDYNRGCCENVCHSGLSELNRLPKYSYYFFRSQIDIGTELPSGPMPAMVYIANWWDEKPKEDKVVVFSNVEEVELKVNGKVIARQKPDEGEDSEYEVNGTTRQNGGSPFDGGNSSTLKHPPFTFENVSFEEGELMAVGYVDGEEVVRTSVGTAQEPESLAFVFDEQGKEVSDNDLIFVHIKIKDKNGNLCTNYSGPVNVTAEGDFNLMSPIEIQAEAGIAVGLVKTKLLFNGGKIHASLKDKREVKGTVEKLKTEPNF